MKKLFITLFLIIPFAHSQYQQPHAGELTLAINRLSVLGSVLYIAAHPDDENTALLSYFTKQKHLRTGYLSITRGEGGQNLIGTELGSALGVIRTEELMAARRVDGAEQFFTRAIDFGYSKSSEEALRFWNKDSIVKDVVWIIRKFRPDIIINRFSPQQGGHGQHLASAILAEEAFKLSGDPSAFPEQLAYVQPWKAKRLLFNRYRFGTSTQQQQKAAAPITIDVGTYNPLLGKSYTEIAGISRTMHKSQGMGSSQNRGTSLNEFIVVAGENATRDLFEGIDITWDRIPGGKKIGLQIAELQRKFSPAQPEKSISLLARIYEQLQKINNNPFVDRKMDEIRSLIQACAGLWIDARSPRPYYSRGDSISFTLTAVNRSSSVISIADVYSHRLNIDVHVDDTLNNNVPLQQQFISIIPRNESFSQPYWLTANSDGARYVIPDPAKVGNAVNEPPLSITVTIIVAKTNLMLTLPVQYRWIDDIEGEKLRNVEVVPPISVSLEHQNIVWINGSEKKVGIRIRSMNDSVKGTIALSAGNGWRVSPAKPFSVNKRDEEILMDFAVQPDSFAVDSKLKAEVNINGEIYRSTLRQLHYNHIPAQLILSDAQCHAIKINLQTRGKSVGYIMGAGDEVPEALEQMGYSVSMISDAELRTGSINSFDAIVAGVRAYNTREQLRLSHHRLMDYVAQGGTYVVQYQVMERGQTDNVGPYPLEISRNRVTDEEAEIKFVRPEHPLLTYPNVLSPADFTDWVQERGLYFAQKWDSKYETLFSCADPGEAQQEGSILYARHGKGHYVFTGLAFFRQLPSGVEGAYRLMANIISIGK